MSSLISMEMSTEEKKEEAVENDSYKRRKYGYGLCLSLDDDQLEKLGINEPLPVGTIVEITAKAIVESTYESASVSAVDGDRKSRNISMQITDMAMQNDGSTDAATVLYSNS